MSVDYYKHLDNEPAFNLKMIMNMDEVAKEVCKLNYGVHRLLSSLVHELRKKSDSLNDEWHKKEDENESPFHSELADGIEELLNKGYYK